MVVYIFLIFLTLMFFSFAKDKKKALQISFILITVVASLRKCTVGADTALFYRAFSFINLDNTWDYTNFRYEAGFYYLCKLLGYVSSDAQILIVVSSIFINYSVYRFIKINSPDFKLSTILYIIMNFYFSNMNIMRQAIALAILLFAFEFLKEKKYFKYIIMVFIATLFHTVSFAALLLLLFSVLPNKRIIYYLEIVMAIITFVFYKQFFYILTLGFGYSGYATSEFGVSNYFGALISALQILFIMAFLYIVSHGKKPANGDNKFRLLSISVILYIWFSFLIIRMNIFNRISGLFGIYSIVAIPIILEKIKNDNISNYRICKIIFLSIYFTSFCIISFFRPEWYGVIPYNFFWQ